MPQKNSLVRFSLRTGLVLITLACVALAWSLQQRRARLRIACESAADHALTRLHWDLWETSTSTTGRELQTLQQQLAQDLAPRAYEYSFIAPNAFQIPAASSRSVAKPSAYEKSLLNEWTAAPPSSGDSRLLIDDESVTYYRPVFGKVNCQMCHNFSAHGINAPQAIAILKIEMPTK